MITVFGCPVNSDYLEMLLKSAGYDPADESGVVKIVATDDGKVTAHWPDGTTSELVGATAGGTAGVTEFISLTDTPSTYSGSETYYLVVNSAGDSVVFEDRPNYLNGFNLYDDDTLPEVSFDGTASRTVTVSPKTASGTFVFWSDNKKFTKTASETVTIPDTTGGYYIYFDDSGTLQYATDPPSSDLITKYALVAHVYWNADYPSEYIWNDNELHGIDMRGAEHLYAHYAFGARWKSGLDINGLIEGSTDYTGSDSGYIYDEDIEHSFSANTTGHPWLYRWGSNGAWRKSAADLKVAYKESGDTYYSYNWYNTASGTWEWKEGTSSTDYWITFFAAVPGVGIVKVPGQAAYSNRANARDAIPTELSRLETEGLPNPEICWLGAVIVKRDGKLQSLADGTVFYDLRMGRGGGTTSKAASAFIDLTDVPGSYSGEAGKAPLVKSTEDGLEFVDVATAGHTHSWSDVSKSGSKLSDIGDVPAYQADKVLGVDSSGTTLQWVANSGGGGTAGATTYLELDDTPSSYSGQAGKVPVVKSDESGLDWFDAASAGHTHDDRYYTETETDSLLDAKADKVSGATSGNFAGLDASGNLTDSGYAASDFVPKMYGTTATATMFVEDVYSRAGTYGTGYLQIKTPFTLANDNECHLMFWLDVYDRYLSASYLIKGKIWHSDDTWYFCHAYPLGNGVETVRFGHDGTNFCVWLGESDTDWGASQVALTKIRWAMCYQYQDKVDPREGWSIGIVTALGTVQRTVTPEYPPDEKVAVSSSTTAGYLYEVISGSLTIDTATSTLQLDNDSSSPGAWKVYGTDGSGTRGWYDMETPRYTKLIAYNTDGRPEYVGEASPGTATSASSWRIKKLTYDTDGNITAVKWADGNSNFDNVWDNRTSYSYS